MQDADMEQIRRLAQSPAGQQLMKLLRQNSALDSAARQAAGGDSRALQKIVTDFLSTPQGQELAKKLGR